ncbi:MAG TPA: UDP-N-acetylmuramoyl-tripeptide--D-alanyl-D-alanine ligase [Stackebrandtia sp.]|nr:UDP-N-acetylmuramoyl-tripeptide--D-alanyl-D-alanine ligase [Stackebrandtia sp.]HZE41330.1 UDP-N-acetylmuramoyl-tripeptide--D-alanyl-D-alanine ligase [Stackebrandtia sp.]
MNLSDIAQVTDGRLSPDADPAAVVTGPVEHDSRKVVGGALFVALVGDHADGHDFAARAVADGAVAVLGSRAVDAPSIVVDDVLVALGKLARAVIDRLDDLTVIGLTGSSGKTSTKDFLAHLCRALGPTVAPEGTLNNELGAPYTALKVDESTRYLVLEMSARHVGDLDYLTNIAPPDIGLALNVGIAHIGEFGSADAIARAKSELIAGIKPGGVAVLNADDPRVSAMRPLAPGRVVTFGTSPDADVRGVDVDTSSGLPRYTLTTATAAAPIALRLHGAHNVSNTLAAAAVAIELGMPVDVLAARASMPVSLSPRRMDVFTRADDITVIDDSYNANPDSMASAIDSLTTLGGAGRTIAVLGYMAELGDTEVAAHRELGRRAARAGVDIVIAVEDVAAPAAEAAAEAGADATAVADQAAAIAEVCRVARSGDTILVKGSRYRTWKVADYLHTEALTKEAHA